MGLCLSSPKPTKKRAGSRTTKPLTLNTIAAAAISEDSLPFSEPKSPRGAARTSTYTPFGVTKAENKLKSKAEAEKQERQKSGLGTNRSGRDSQSSSRNPTPNNSPENKTTDLTKSTGVSSSQTRHSSNIPGQTPATEAQSDEQGPPKNSDA